MKILVISNNYPSTKAPTYGVFVYNLIQEFVKLGHEVNVIACSSRFKIEKTNNSNTPYGVERATVFYPKTISASNKWILGFNTHLIGEYFSVRSIKKFVKANNIEFDVVYAHFLVNGIISVKALHDLGKPIFVAEGELKNINLRKQYYSDSEYLNLISKIKGFISVSPQIKQNLIEVGVDEDKIIIQPNGIDPKRFFPRPKDKMRMKHKLPMDKKLVIFVGRFVHDKGPVRVLNAIKEIDDVGLVLIGQGNQTLEDNAIVFKGKVPTNIVPEFLSAADLFVLPTLHEGSCNAIIEAMACGLPVVSSDIPEIQFQCKKDSSILIDPLDEKKIKAAIEQLLNDDKKRFEMGVAAHLYSKNFEIGNRAKRILE